MSIYSLTPLASTIAYAVLGAVVLHSARGRIRAIFSIYLIVSLLFSLVTFITLADLLPSQVRLGSAFLPIGGVCVSIAYYHFVCVFTHKTNRLALALGYGVVAFVFIPLAVLGYFPRSAQIVNGGLDVDQGPLLYPLGATGLIFIVLSITALWRRLKALRDSLERTRVIYLLVGIGLFVLLGIRETVPPLPRFPLSQVGHLANALVITYAILRYQLLDIMLIIKKGLVHSGVIVTLVAVYLVALYISQSFVQNWTDPWGVGAVIALAALMACLFNPLKRAMQGGVDRLFYGKSYDYRRTVLSFAQRMSNILDLNELAEAMLTPISKALHASQVSLLLPINGKFSSEFAVRLIEGEPLTPLTLRNESPITAWLARENEVLSRELVDVVPEFKGLWQGDRDALDSAETALLCPMISKGNLTSILAVSKKQRGGCYSKDDIDLVNTLAHEAAAVIQNAQLYAEAKQRANVDELTGLFNHRYFHQRIEEEIDRCSRFGEIFSLLSLDLDLFKTYNDVCGHVAGDYILQYVGRHIRSSVRTIDIAFRYGGDEFAVILIGTSLDGAQVVAERIRKGLEAQMDVKGIQMTCSIGIASWPTGGVLREEILKSADAALYYAKETGRNRICSAPAVVLSQVEKIKVGIGNSRAILSTIYALAATVDAKDHYTYGHSKKVSKYATEIAEAIGYSKERIEAIRTAGLLHDIGKIGVSDRILGKQGSLSAEEWEPIHAHPIMGVSILKHVDGLNDCLAAIQYHHERYDGSGYPSGLKGDNIPIDARIMAVADSYDAMTSPRPYRTTELTPEKALGELKRCAGTQFDPKIVEAFVRTEAPLHSKTTDAKRSPALNRAAR